MKPEIIALIAVIVVCAVILTIILVLAFGDRKEATTHRHEHDLLGVEVVNGAPTKPAAQIYLERNPTFSERRRFDALNDATRESRAQAEELRRRSTPRPTEETISDCHFFTKPPSDDVTARFVASGDNE